MKYSILLYIIFLVHISCNKKATEKPTIQNRALKVITTKVYQAKQEFDKLVQDKPIREIAGIFKNEVYTWSTKHFDQYGNIIYQECLEPNETGEGRAFRKITKEYFDSSKGQLSRVIEETESWWTFEEKYIRNPQGRLQEKHVMINGRLDTKTIFTYNELGQKIKMEAYKENGLYEITIYTYDTNSLNKNNIVNEIHEVKGDYNYKEDITYKRDSNNHILNTERKYYEGGVLESEISTTYLDFVDGFATKVIRQGYYPPKKYTNGTITKSEPFKEENIYILNDNKDIIEYSTKRTTLSKEKGAFSSFAPSFPPNKYEYTYNDRNEWIKLFVKEMTATYIINREIKYFD